MQHLRHSSWGKFASWLKYRLRKRSRPLKRSSVGSSFEALEERCLLSIPPLIGEFQVNSTTANVQQQPDVATNDAGHTVAVWSSGNSGIYGQRFNAAGQPQGPEFQVSSSFGRNPAVAVDAGGNYVVAWESSGVLARHYSSSGSPGSEFRPSPAGVGTRGVSVAMDTDGDFVIVWAQEHVLRDHYSIFGQVYDTTGTAEGGNFQVDDGSLIYTSEYPDIGMDRGPNHSHAEGSHSHYRYAVAWNQRRMHQPPESDERNVFARQYDQDGPQNVPFRLNTYSVPDFAQHPSLAMDDCGSFFVVWGGSGPGDDSGIFVQSKGFSTGTVVRGEVQVNRAVSGRQSNPAVSQGRRLIPPLACQNDFVVAWDSQDADGTGIYAQHLNFLKQPRLDHDSLLNSTTSGNQLDPAVAMRTDGTFFAAWSGAGVADSDGISGRRFGRPPNEAPELAAIGNQVIAEGSQLSFRTTASDPNPIDSVTFSLDPGAPAGVSIDPSTGSFTWTPTEDQGPGVFSVTVRVSDNGGPSMSDSETIEVRVNEINTAPELQTIGNQSTTRQKTLSFTATASDPDLPANSLTFSLAAGAPSGATISPQTGQFSWTPTAAQLGEFSVTVEVRDGGSPILEDSETVTLRVADLIAVGSEFRVNTTTQFSQNFPSADMDADGDLVVAWSHQSGIKAQRYDSSGQPEGGEFDVGGGDSPKVSIDVDGDFSITAANLVYQYNAAGLVQGTALPPSPGFPASTWSGAGDGFVEALARGGDIFGQRYDDSGQPLGSEFLINTHTDGFQFGPSAAVDAQGNFVVAWTSPGQDPGDQPGQQGVYAQRFDSAGKRIGGEFRVPTTTSGSQALPSVDIDPDGDFLIAWQSMDSSGNSGVFAQPFDRNGLPVGVEFRVNTSQPGFSPSVAMGANGESVVVWQGPDVAGSHRDIFGQRFQFEPDRSGAIVGSVLIEGSAISEAEELFVDDVSQIVVSFSEEISTAEEASGLNSITNPANWTVHRNGGEIVGSVSNVGFELNSSTNKYEAALTFDDPLTVGDFVLTALDSILDLSGNPLDGDFDGEPGGDFSRSFTLVQATPRGSEFLVNSTTAGIQQRPAAALDADGDLIIIWQSDGQAGIPSGVYAQRFDNSGALNGPELLLSQRADASLAAVASQADGGFVASWQATGTDGTEIYASRYNSAGLIERNFRVNTVDAGEQTKPTLASGRFGSFAIAWEGPDGSGTGVFLQPFNKRGMRNGNELQVNSTTDGNQSSPTIAIGLSGIIFLAWESEGQDGSGKGIFGQLLEPSGKVLASEFRINTTTSGDQLSPEAAATKDGFVVTWHEGSSESDIFGQRFNVNGVAQGSEFLVNTITSGSQTSPQVVADWKGDYLIGWRTFDQDGDGFGIAAQRFNSSGIAQGSEFAANDSTAGDQILTGLAMDADGGILVAWEGHGPGDNSGVFGQLFDGNVDTSPPWLTGVFRRADDQDYLHPICSGDQLIGTLPDLVIAFSEELSTEGGVTGTSSVTNPANWMLSVAGLERPGGINEVQFGFDPETHLFQASLTLDANGLRPGVNPLGEGDYRLTARDSISDKSGNPLDGNGDGIPGGDFQIEFHIDKIVPVGSNFSVGSTVAGMDNDGNFIVVGSRSSPDVVHARLFGIDNSPETDEFVVNTTTEATNGKAAMDSTGNFVVLWNDPSTGNILGERYSADAEIQGDEFLIGKGNLHDVSMHSSGSFAALWVDNGIKLRLFNPNAAPLGNEFLIDGVTPSSSPQVALGDGFGAITWANGSEVNARLFEAPGNWVGDPFKVNSGGNILFASDVSVAPDGHFVVAWANQIGQNFSTSAQQFNPAGVPVGNELLVDVGQRFVPHPHVAVDSNGDFTIAVLGGFSSSQITVRHFSATGILDSEYSYSSSQLTALVANHQGSLLVGGAGAAQRFELRRPDIRILEATADGFSNLKVSYEILSPTPSQPFQIDPFEIGFYRSFDDNLSSLDEQLDSVLIANASDLSAGVHHKSFIIGSGAGRIGLPGAGAIENDNEYHILVTVDWLDDVAESDSDPFNQNNTVSFAGIYHPASGDVFVHGTARSDILRVSPGSLRLQVEERIILYDSDDISGLRVRGHAGDDTIDITPVPNLPIWVDGGSDIGGDTLNYYSDDSRVTDDGTKISAPGFPDVAYQDAESVNLRHDSAPRRFTLDVRKLGSGVGIVRSLPRGSGINCSSDCSETYEAGTQVTLKAIPLRDSIFVGWRGVGCAGTGNCKATVDSDRTATAIFVNGPVNLEVGKQGAGNGRIRSIPRGTGINCGNDCAESYDFGTRVTLRAIPFQNSTFAGWQGACSGTANCRLTMNSSETVTAVFDVRTAQLNVQKTGSGVGIVRSVPRSAGINCSRDCTETFEHGTEVTLKAIPLKDSTFVGWQGGGCSGNRNCKLTMNSDSTVTAIFEDLTATLHVQVQGPGIGTVRTSPVQAGINCGKDCGETYETGQRITLRAIPFRGSVFAGWQGDVCQGTKNCRLTLTDDKTVVARFHRPLLSSLSTSTAVPGTLLRITGVGFDPDADSLVQFRDQTGLKLEIPAVETTPTEITVSVPPLLDSAANLTSGTANIRVMQAAGTSLLESNPIGGFQIQSLPSPNVPSGQTTLNQLETALGMVQKLQQEIATTALDADLIVPALQEQQSQLEEFIDEVDGLIGNPDNSLLIESIHDHALTIGLDQLLNSDRLILGALQAVANLGAGHCGSSEAAALVDALLSNPANVEAASSAFGEGFFDCTIDEAPQSIRVLAGSALVSGSFFGIGNDLSPLPVTRAVAGATPNPVLVRSAGFAAYQGLVPTTSTSVLAVRSNHPQGNNVPLGNALRVVSSQILGLIGVTGQRLPKKTHETGQGIGVATKPGKCLIRIDNTQVAGRAGEKAKFKISADGIATGPIKVKVQTLDGSAKAGEHYEQTDEELELTCGQSKTVDVGILRRITGVKDFFAFIIVQSNEAQPTKSLGIATITGDDPTQLPKLSIHANPGRRREGDGTSILDLNLEVRLSKPISEEVRFRYFTRGGSATPDKDYTRVDLKQGRILANSETGRITIAVRGDEIDEFNESVGVVLDRVITGNAQIDTSQKQAFGTILDNDPPPQITVKNKTIKEGDGEAVSAVVIVEIPEKSEKPVRFTAMTKNGTAKADKDYEPLAPKRFIIQPGKTRRKITIPIIGNKVPESNRSFIVAVSKEENAAVKKREGVVTIKDDDEAPVANPGDLILDYSVSANGQTINGTLTFEKNCSSSNSGVNGTYRLKSDTGGLITNITAKSQGTVSGGKIIFTTQGAVGTNGSGQLAFTESAGKITGKSNSANFIRATNSATFTGGITGGSFSECN